MSLSKQTTGSYHESFHQQHVANVGTFLFDAGHVCTRQRYHQWLRQLR
jgi:hypothetical protein